MCVSKVVLEKVMFVGCVGQFGKGHLCRICLEELLLILSA